MRKRKLGRRFIILMARKYQRKIMIRYQMVPENFMVLNNEN
tara:strand:+ start:807 stop:929 length:123 start_codon:yes stop_codon:yes gene_type:complete